MNYNLKLIADWLALNKLSLNVGKTVTMTFGSYCISVPEQFIICINNEIVKRVETCKYLGIILDYRLTWNDHVNFVSKKTKYLTVLFYKLSQIMKTETLIMIYYALFHNRVTYGLIAWGGAYSNNLQILQNQQNKLLKIINKGQFMISGYPLSLEQFFSYESLLSHYETLSDKCSSSTSTTRRKLK